MDNFEQSKFAVCARVIQSSILNQEHHYCLISASLLLNQLRYIIVSIKLSLLGNQAYDCSITAAGHPVIYPNDRSEGPQ